MSRFTRCEFPILDPDLGLGELKKEALSVFTTYASTHGWVVTDMPTVTHVPARQVMRVEARIRTKGHCPAVYELGEDAA